MNPVKRAGQSVAQKVKSLNADGVQNGTITKFRIIASGLIGLGALGAGTFLLYHQVPVPEFFWYIALGSVGGVVGLDLVASVVKTVLRKE